MFQNTAPPTPPAPGMVAYREVTQALSALSQGNTFLYVAETKKLCLAIIQAEQVVMAMQVRQEPCDRTATFRHELQTQISAFALMRVLSREQVKAAAERASAKETEGLVETPPLSPSGMLLRELEAAAGSGQEQRLQEELIAQPLFQLATQNAELLARLEQTYGDCVSNVPQLLKSANQSLHLLSKQNATPGPAPF
ncbi:MAG: hypothetical protein ACYCW6_15100 [Candidatus Xenobia bacterium]